ncbi:MAG TPA: NAD(P)-binding domain-containing protein [Papillibacter sp.]|jgi:pyrroline-5-carboxylate reductase|nr:NAD(P)-binding domain-containing protein [Papillibacter sp.]
MKISVIGYGNLGRSLVSGLLKSGSQPHDLCVCDASPAALGDAESLGLVTTNNPAAAAEHGETIFLVVKSHMFDEMAPILASVSLEGKTVVSFMAGVSIDALHSKIGEVSLVRAMPSLAISVCDGVIGYTKAPEQVAALFHRMGYAFEVKADEIEKVMAFSSCGLGFAAYLIDAFVSAGELMGFSLQDSLKIAEITFRNALDRGDYKGTVKAVATRGGATEQGILHMDAAGVFAIISGAVRKAYEKMV